MMKRWWRVKKRPSGSTRATVRSSGQRSRSSEKKWDLLCWYLELFTICFVDIWNYSHFHKLISLQCSCCKTFQLFTLKKEWRLLPQQQLSTQWVWEAIKTDSWKYLGFCPNQGGGVCQSQVFIISFSPNLKLPWWKIEKLYA